MPHNSPNLGNSQIGLTKWTAAEKELFFEALTRLGPDDAAGIAARIRTKGEFETAQYLRLLREVGTSRKRGRELDMLVAADVPAAVELSQACCSALEDAADAISLRQETHEETLERQRWGQERWLITKVNRRDVERDPPPQSKQAVDLFCLKTWLRLSDRVFMNAAYEEYNWRSVSDEQPALRTTTLVDFHSLVVSVVRRLVAATIYVTESRIHAKRAVHADLQRQVSRRDVDAAVLSLGFPANSRRFWARCARRLRLNVYDDESWDARVASDEEEPEPMSFDDVERALGADAEDPDNPLASERGDSETDPSEEELAALSDTPLIDDDEGAGTNPRTDPSEEGEEEEEEEARLYPGVDDEQVRREANELLVFSALDYPKSTRAKHTLMSRIRLAHAHDAYADAVDARASYTEERRLWTLLGRTPPTELGRPPQVPKPPPPSGLLHPVDDLLCTTMIGGRGWRDGLGAIGSSWEVDPRVSK